MFTTFTPRPDMLAHELMHIATAPLPLHIATMVAGELGSASFHKKGDCAWYADAHVDLDNGEHVVAPFALRIDRNGNATLAINWMQSDLMSHAINSLVPHIEIEPIRGRANRAA